MKTEKNNQKELKEKIISLMDEFGMSDRKASEIMGISYNTFRLNKIDGRDRNRFIEKHYDKLLAYLKSKVNEINAKS